MRTLSFSPAGVVFWRQLFTNAVTAAVTANVTNEEAPGLSELCGFVPHAQPADVVVEFTRTYGNPAPMSPQLNAWLEEWTYLPNNI